MAGKTVISKLLEEDAADFGIIEFPQNRTLYVDQFTGTAEICDEERDVFNAKSLKAVFEHYKPCKDDIILSTIDGKEVVETFYFHEIKDFDVDRIIEHSPLLSSQKAMIDTCDSEENALMKVFSENLVRIQNEIHDLEASYRGVESFFLNTKQENIEFLTLMNVGKNKLCDLGSEDSLYVQNEIIRGYDSLSLKNNYSLLVLPGYLGNAKSIHQWAQFSYQCRLLTITDYRDLANADTLMTNIQNDELQGTEPYLGNIIMAVNYLIVRRRSDDSNDFCIPASSAIAGRLANVEDWTIERAAVGVKTGNLVGCHGTRIKLQNSEITSIIAHGLIPVCEEDGIVSTMSCRTLYNGSVLTLHNYAHVRVFDWIEKVVHCQCISELAFQKCSYKIAAWITQDLQDFLNDCKGTFGIIEDFQNLKIIQDYKTKNIKVSVEIKFHFMDQPFVLEIIGENECDRIEWKRNILVS